MKRALRSIICLLATVALFAPGVAFAQEGGEAAPAGDTSPAPEVEAEAEGDPAPYQDGGLLAGAGLVIGVKLGGGFSQVFSDLGSSFVGELELGYLLPLPEPVGRGIELFATGSYAGPSTDGTVSNNDARLPGDGSFSYEVTVQQAIIGFGLLYRIPLPTDIVHPYIGGGTRIYLTAAEVSGEASGEAFGDNEETSTSVGGFGIIGADFFLGPGAILLEVQAAGSELDNFVMQNTNTGALNVAVGYRLFL